MTPLAIQASLPDETRPVILYVRPQAINLLLGQEDSFSFDCSGRPIGAFWNGVTYRRSLENRWLAKWAERNDSHRQRQRRWLDPDEARSLLSQGHSIARVLRTALVAGRARLLRAETSDEEGREVALAALDRVLAWDWDALEADRERFLHVYKPIGILPPDQYLSLVLQATEGCSHNACTFCTFYRDRPFRIKTPEEFAAHIQSVLDFFGPAIALRRTVFLGDANALVIPFPRLKALFEVMNRMLPIAPASPGIHAFAGVYSFMDAFHAHRKSAAEWRMLRERGLRRVYIGMESGDDGLLRFLNKPGSAEDVVSAVQRLKEAGVAVSVIILLGAGGELYFEAHIQGTIRAINAMPLEGGDLIYFSDLVELPGNAYTAIAQAAGIQPLSEQRMREQEHRMRTGFHWRNPSNPPKLSRYDIREFLY
ncbi:MAG: radical SAM protein [Anaerolineae bacterium]|nr:radical SAM protein [Anaerolineae bacterium]MDW8100651.1 radical SAM protein [Anaerolineae bacterium]